MSVCEWTEPNKFSGGLAPAVDTVQRPGQRFCVSGASELAEQTLGSREGLGRYQAGVCAEERTRASERAH